MKSYEPYDKNLYYVKEEKASYYARHSPGYPEKLLPLERMPTGLYVIGSLPDPHRKSVAIVGARSCSRYGRAQALHFGQVLSAHGVQIISGLAYGVDAWAHQGALDGGGKTFAVMGSGVDVCYPKANYPLYRKIIQTGGGILSELEPGSHPKAWHFPIRNRIISGLADLVLVIEARRKSGSLITADYALEQGKSVYALPGRTEDSLSEGCNALIAQGAGIALSPEQLLEELGIPQDSLCTAHSSSENDPSADPFAADTDPSTDEAPLCTGPSAPEIARALTDHQKVVYRSLCQSEKNLENLLESTGLSMQELPAILLDLRLKGLIRETLPGYYYHC